MANHDVIFFRHFKHSRGVGYIQLAPFSSGIDYEVSISGIPHVSSIRIRHKRGHDIAVITPIRRFLSDAFFDLGTISPDFIEGPYSIVDLFNLLHSGMAYVVIQTLDGLVLVNSFLEPFVPAIFIRKIKPLVVVIRHACHRHDDDEDDDFDRKHHCETRGRIKFELRARRIDINIINVRTIVNVVDHIHRIDRQIPLPAPAPRPGQTQPPPTHTRDTAISTPNPDGSVTQTPMPSTDRGSDPTPTSPPPAPSTEPGPGSPLAKTPDLPLTDKLSPGRKRKNILGSDTKTDKPLSEESPTDKTGDDSGGDPLARRQKARKSSAGRTPHLPLLNRTDSPTELSMLAAIDNHPTATFFIGGVLLFGIVVYLVTHFNIFKGKGKRGSRR